MKNFELLSLGIYKKSGEISVENEFIKQLYKDADAHPRNRSRILIHKDSDSIPQEMLIAFTSKSIVEVSTHIFPESFTVLDGVAKYIFYKDNGELIGDVLLSPYENEALELTSSKKTEPRIPFGWLVERKLLEPGTTLFDQSKKFKAKVRADGSIVSSNNKGSIHQIGAEVQDASACNGWTFWHFDVEGELKPIDLLRQKLRSELN